ncbi:DUF3265 domain-containing protein [Vibrio diabolicus]|nr:DUF3265 domain-containing protein [Vibrio diabolicus]
MIFGVCKVKHNLKSAHWVCQLTSASRRIRNAWHFYHALFLVFKVVCCSIGIALLTT